MEEDLGKEENERTKQTQSKKHTRAQGEGTAERSCVHWVRAWYESGARGQKPLAGS